MAYHHTYTVKHGKHAGSCLTPHRYDHGHFHDYKFHFRTDPEGIMTEFEDALINLIQHGFHVRMSNRNVVHAASTACPDIVQFD